MAKKAEKVVAKRKKESGEQLDLIDVLPEDAKPIIEKAREYRKTVAARQKLTDKEAKQKQEVLELVKDAHIQPVEDGIIKFKHDGYTISITPRDVLVKITGEDPA